MALPVLAVNNLRKQFGRTSALDGVTFTVAAGELFGLLGPNGAGKTTLLSIVSCLLEADGGQIQINGRELTLHDRVMRRSIGIVPQELAIYGDLTGRENLQFFGSLYGLRSDRLRARVETVLVAIGLADRAADRAETYSGGMKRRLNLGAALVHEPTLLLLDEPTTGVDPQSRNHIFEEVRRINAGGVTVVYTSHYMEEVQALCPRVGIIDHGRLIALGPVQELLQTLPGLMRVRVPQATCELRSRIANLPEIKAVRGGADLLEIESRDVRAALTPLLGLLNEARVDLLGLETEEPNLERVFLHLTGRALRD